jgi:antitoxin component YwqK of YwqJK toxin-antitoxin module
MRKVIFFGISVGMALTVSSCANRSQTRVCVVEPEALSQTYIHKYGLQIAPGEWQNRGQNGQVVSTLKSGVVVTKNYKDGFLDGETTYTFPHSGAVQRVELYSQGRLMLETENYSTGLKKRQVDFESPTQRSVTVWYDNGTPQYHEEYENNKLVEGEYFTVNQQLEARIDQGTGRRVNRDEYGSLVSEDKIQYGELVMRTLFYPNGAPKEIIPYQHGVVTGLKRTFLPGGEPETVEEWDNDRREGTTIVFQNGEKIAEVPYFNGDKNGVEQRFRDGEFLVEEVTWKNGQKHGPCYRFIGESTIVEYFNNGRKVPRVEYDRQIHHLIR